MDAEEEQEHLKEMLQSKHMERSSALRLAVVALLAFICLIHASAAEIAFPPAPGVLQETGALPASRGADDQAVFAGETEASAVGGRMELELQDYPSSGANDRHSPWRQETRN